MTVDAAEDGDDLANAAACVGVEPRWTAISTLAATVGTTNRAEMLSPASKRSVQRRGVRAPVGASRPDKVTKPFIVTDAGERVEIPPAEENKPTHKCTLCGMVAMPR